MDRLIVYPGAIPLETDILTSQKNAFIGLSKLAAAMLGTATIANGLGCVPTGPASLQVFVNPGEIYSLVNIDGTSYGSLAADTTHQIVKQGILLDQATLNCPAPGTAGFSINYLVEAQYQDLDGTSIVLPYYNAANPAVAFSGPNNTGVAQNTVRQGKCAVQVKAGTAATTGTQTTPAADSGWVGLWVVTVANGQTQITSTSIALLAGAPFIPSTGAIGNLRGSAVFLSANTSLTAVQSGQLIEVTAAGATTQTLPAPAASLVGLSYYFLASGAGVVTLASAAGTFSGGGYSAVSTLPLLQGMSAIVTCDGANWVITALSVGASVLNTAGYQKLPSGLIVQWGNWNTNATTGVATAVTFPIAFPTSLYNLISSQGNSTNTTTSAAWTDTGTLSGFNGRANQTGIVAYFIAIGK